MNSKTMRLAREQGREGILGSPAIVRALNFVCSNNLQVVQGRWAIPDGERVKLFAHRNLTSARHT